MASAKAFLVSILLVVGFEAFMYLIIIGLAANFYHELLEPSGLQGANRASFYLLTWSFPGALIGFAALVEACRYLLCHPDARHSSFSINLLAALFSLLPFGWACQQLNYQHTSSQWNCLAAFWVIVPWFQWFVAFMLLSGDVYEGVVETHRGQEQNAPSTDVKV